MLTFWDQQQEFDPEIIKESKLLRAKFKFVVVKIMKKWLKSLREKRENWTLDEFESYNTNEFSGKVKVEILELATKLAGVAVMKENVASQIEQDVVDQLSEDFFELKNYEMDSFLLKVKEHVEIMTNDYMNETTTCQKENVTEGKCLKNLKKYHTLFQFPFEVNKEDYLRLGFGTYLAYFSKLLPNLDKLEKRFLMNDKITQEEKETRQYLNLILTNLVQEEQMGKMSIWELTKLLHPNANGYGYGYGTLGKFAPQLQNEIGCKYLPTCDYYKYAWDKYTKAYFAY